ncbi:MAG: hypothetical protein K6E47_00535 [Lachnospiraceae bacterium]|nr:hypothetical protein [Lachnospiraceae bacterium]
MKKHIRCLSKLLAVLIVSVSILTLLGPIGIKAKENEVYTNIKMVYNVKQLKKAMKTDYTYKIVFRTETYDKITIPSVKAAKNKDIIICAAHADVKNKAKFKSITVESVNSYTETVSGNTIIWKCTRYNSVNLEVSKKKKVKKLVFADWKETDPQYTVRKGAKIKSIEFEGDGYTSSYDSKNRTITLTGKDPYIDSEMVNIKTYSFDKSGRCIEVRWTNSENEYDFLDTYEYDKNGNNVYYESKSRGSRYLTIKYEYNSKNVLLKQIGDEGTDKELTIEYLYDKKGNLETKCYYDAYDSVEDTIEYSYDDKGRLSEEFSTAFHYYLTYAYDKEGRVTESKHIKNAEVYINRFIYDDNGLLIKEIEGYEDDDTTVFEYSLDGWGNRIFSISGFMNEEGIPENSSRTEYYVGDFIGEYPVYGDAYTSPVNGKSFDKTAYEKAGYTVVTNVEEFLEAIKPEATIIIEPGTYYMSDYIEYLDRDEFNNSHKYVKLEESYDGYEIYINGVYDLTICGGNANPSATTLVIDPRSSAVFHFTECNGLKLCSFTCGHTATGYCIGNVIDLYNCHDVGMYAMNIFGCGVYGIGAYYNSGNIRLYNCVIHDCENGIFYFCELDEDIVFFDNCMFYGNYAGGEIYPTVECYPLVTFQKCSFGINESKKDAIWGEYVDIDCLWSESE